LNRCQDLVNLVPQVLQLPWAFGTIPLVNFANRKGLCILTKEESFGRSDSGMIVFDRQSLHSDRDLYAHLLGIMASQEAIYEHGLDLDRFVVVQGLAIPTTGTIFALPLNGAGLKMHAQIINQSLAQPKILANAWMSIVSILELWHMCKEKHKVWLHFSLLEDVYIDGKNSSQFKILPQSVSMEEPKRVVKIPGKPESFESFYLEKDLAHQGLCLMLFYAGQFLAASEPDANKKHLLLSMAKEGHAARKEAASKSMTSKAIRQLADYLTEIEGGAIEKVEMATNLADTIQRELLDLGHAVRKGK